MLFPIKYCSMNILLNLVEFQLKQTEITSISSLRMRIIRHYDFLMAMLFPYKYCPINILVYLAEF